jgi:deoxyribonuclease-4
MAPQVGRDTDWESVPDMPPIGAQISTAGGLTPVPQRAVAIGAEVVQVFSSNPRTWRARPHDHEELAAFTAGLREHGLPLFLHTIYLLNLASPDEELRRRSQEALCESLVVGKLTDAAGVVTHIGSHRGDGFRAALPRIRAAVQAATDLARESLAAKGGEQTLPPLLLENSAGSGATVGGRLEELTALLAELPPSCGLCLDTAHLFAAGYPVHTPSGLKQLVERLFHDGLAERVSLIHLNDSKTPFASGRDQHENPGAGYIGWSGLARVVRHPAFAAIPFVLEVPGALGHGPDAANVALVKLMRKGREGRSKRPARDA